MVSTGRSRFLLGGGHNPQKILTVEIFALTTTLLQAQPAAEMNNNLSSQMSRMIWHYERQYQAEMIRATTSTIVPRTHSHHVVDLSGGVGDHWWGTQHPYSSLTDHYSSGTGLGWVAQDASVAL